MKQENRWCEGGAGIKWFVLLMLMLTSTILNAAQFKLNVVDKNGNPVNGFRWLLQEDKTFPVDPANPATTPDELLSMGFHASNHPPALAQNDGHALQGNEDTDGLNVTNVTPGRYYVSVLPYAGHSISGNQVTVLPNSQDQNNTLDSVTVVVQKHPIPTAQITIYLFEDTWPINGVPDLPEELNPAVGEPGHVDWSRFTLVLEEPAGRYGQNGGAVIQDAFGNPLGTTYIRGCDADGQPDADPTTNYGCFDAFGDPIVDLLGDGSLHPDQNGYLTVKNLSPGKYGVIITPPTPAAGEQTGWVQTSTIEGTKVIDAWVKANEPQVFVEFGLPGPHVFMGFVKPSVDGGFAPLPGGATITGTITDMHMSRSPNFQFFDGRPVPQCWIGVNEMNAGAPGAGLYAAPCDAASGFNIAGLAPGSYQLAIWDKPLDLVIAAQPFTVDADINGAATGTCNGGGSCDFGDIPVFNWFARLKTGVFNDLNQDGFWDEDGLDNIPGTIDDETGIGPDSQSVALRWRDGSIYQTFATDVEGFAPFDEVFPFFHWLVAEVSFANKKATGATFVIDAGGEVNPDGIFPDPPAFDPLNPWAYPSFAELTPQEQNCTPAQSLDPEDPNAGCTVGAPLINPNTGNNYSRTELGQVLTTGIQAFLGQTSVLYFGKTDYVSFTAPDFTQFPPVLPQFVGENGGISGIVYYATTRAEDDPQLAVAETWEPGIPRVQLALYADGDIDCMPTGDFPNSECDIDWNQNGGPAEPDDGVIDDVNGNGVIELADVDNYPLGNFPGVEDVNRCAVDDIGCTEVIAGSSYTSGFDLGDALSVTWTDSWDDNLPTGCQGQNLIDFDLDGTITPEENSRCFDGLRNFNQVRPGVFDGGYAFSDYDMANLVAVNPDAANKLLAFYADRQTLVANLPAAWILPSDYIVQAATPNGFKLVQEEHKNVDYGDSYIPSTQALAPTCVGDLDPVPPYLAMATKDGSGEAAQLIAGVEAIPAPFAGEMRPLCDRKQVPLSAGQNAAAEFFLMTDVPVGANATGVILNDLANEFNPNSPAFGEKFAPPRAPVAFYDAEGNQVSRIYADAYGRYNAVLPSTFTADRPQPSGMAPNMLVSCMNDAGPVPNPAYNPALDPSGIGIDSNGNTATMVDPYFNPQYSQFCYTFQYMPGVATYLDTPVEPIAAFAGPGQFPVDCERPTLTPEIQYVKRANERIGPFVMPGGQVEIHAMGSRVLVPNPEWDGVNPDLRYVERNYNFGGRPGLAELDPLDGTARIPLTIDNWNGNRVLATVPDTVLPGDYQLVVTRIGGVPEPIESTIGVTLTVGTCVGALNAGVCSGTEAGVRPNAVDPLNPTADELYNVWTVGGTNIFQTIQEAIDFAAPGDMILVESGVYDEMVVMWKPLKLQGWGAGAVTLNARQSPTEKIMNWRALVESLDANGLIDRLIGQTIGALGFPGLGANLFPSEEGAGIVVFGKRTGTSRFNHPANRNSRIDGFTIIGASQGGGIVLNGFNSWMNISNNRVTSNSGIYGGGIRVGHPNISHEIADDTDYNLGGVDENQIADLVYDDALNDRVNIRFNHVAQNGNTNGTGGGISLHVGADAYRVQDNWVCGNFSKGNGGGIAHFGRSNGGVIEDNYVIFNEVFNQQPGTAPSGAGVFIGGQPALQPATRDPGLVTSGLLLSSGTGTVTVDSNIIRGNLAGAGDGSGIRVDTANGLDVDRNPTDRTQWYATLLYNNMINNNVAGVAGAVSLSDSLRVVIRNNTVANNDSTATGSQAFNITTPNQSVAQPAGLVSRLHGAVTSQLFSTNYVDPTVLVRPEGALFSDPVLRNNITFHNRSFFWLNYDDPNTVISETGIFPATATCLATVALPFDPTVCTSELTNIDDYTNDLGIMSGIVETADLFDARTSLMQTGELVALPNSNTFIPPGDPGFVNEYFNQSRDGFLFPEFTTLATAGAFDEGGNFIQVAFGPISLIELDALPRNPEGPLFDYHITAASAAINNGGDVNSASRLGVDFDNQARPNNGLNDIGADEAM